MEGLLHLIQGIHERQCRRSISNGYFLSLRISNYCISRGKSKICFSHFVCYFYRLPQTEATRNLVFLNYSLEKSKIVVSILVLFPDVLIAHLSCVPFRANSAVPISYLVSSPLSDIASNKCRSKIYL